jgi:hypothetical protein
LNARAFLRSGSLIVLALAVAALSACGQSVATGQGAPASPAESGSGSPTASSSIASSAAPSSSVSASSVSASATQTASLTATITGTGTLAGKYVMSLWAHDVITDCGAHSHGTPIVAYFAAHPCRSATRRLWTTPIGGRTLALSIISVSAQITKVNENPDFEWAQQLADLENADGTGSVNDLIREGERIPGAGTSIPTNEVFSVLAQDGLVVIIDGWYVTGSTNPKDAQLASIEVDLTFSDAAAPDA